MTRTNGAARVFRARRLLVDAATYLEGGGLLVRGGRVLRLLQDGAAVRRASRRWGAPATEFDTGVLCPGLVNAHAHLELSGLAGRVPPGADFPAWIEALLRERAGQDFSQLEAAAAAGSQALLRSGTTCVGDVDSSGAAEAALRGGPLRARLYRELLDPGGPAQRAAVLAVVRRAPPRRARRLEGLSPHAPYTCSPELLEAAASLARRRDLPLAIHWSETPEELAWLIRAEGPFGRLLTTSPHLAGLDAIERAGLLGPRTALVHGNHPGRGEVRRVAESGASLVHCPGSHAFFDRPAFPLERYRRAGCALALGTDSLASNGALDMRREMSLLRATAPGLAPKEVWRMATEGGARALGLADRIGALTPGKAADLVHYSCSAETRQALLDELTGSPCGVRGVWMAGRRLGLESSVP